jgi:hypothetical protein
MAGWKTLTNSKTGEQIHVNLDVAEMKQFPDYTELWLSRDYKIEVREEPDAIFAAPDAADW